MIVTPRPYERPGAPERERPEYAGDAEADAHRRRLDVAEEETRPVGGQTEDGPGREERVDRVERRIERRKQVCGGGGAHSVCFGLIQHIIYVYIHYVFRPKY